MLKSQKRERNVPLELYMSWNEREMSSVQGGQVGSRSKHLRSCLYEPCINTSQLLHTMKSTSYCPCDVRREKGPPPELWLGDETSGSAPVQGHGDRGPLFRLQCTLHSKFPSSFNYSWSRPLFAWALVARSSVSHSAVCLLLYAPIIPGLSVPPEPFSHQKELGFNFRLHHLLNLEFSSKDHHFH
jgi:hypothetical protein